MSNRVSDYTNRINRFGNAIEKMVAEDFPKEPKVIENIEVALAQIQITVLQAFMLKGGKAE